MTHEVLKYSCVSLSYLRTSFFVIIAVDGKFGVNTSLHTFESAHTIPLQPSTPHPSIPI